MSRKKEEVRIDCTHIVNPNLVIMGTAIPQYFYKALTKRVLENGLFARCIIIEAGKRGEAGTPTSIVPTDSLLRAAKYLVNLELKGNLTNEYPRPLIISETPEATAMLNVVRELCDERYNFFEAKHEAGAMALWARAFEKVCKLAMLHGISSNVYNPLITEKSVKWAWQFIDHLTRRMLYMANLHVYENQFDEKCQKVIRFLTEAGGKMQHSKLLKKSKECVDVFNKVIDTLVESGVIRKEWEETKTKCAKVYVLR